MKKTCFSFSIIKNVFSFYARKLKKIQWKCSPQFVKLTQVATSDSQTQSRFLLFLLRGRNPILAINVLSKRKYIKNAALIQYHQLPLAL